MTIDFYCHNVIWGCPQSKGMQILKASAKEDNRLPRKVTDMSLQEAIAVVKNPPANAGDIGDRRHRRRRRHRCSPWVRKIPWRRKWQPTPVFLPGESHGQRSLVGYSPWITKSWTWLIKHTYTHIHTHTNTRTQAQVVTQVEGKFTDANRGIIFANRISHSN